MLTSARISKTCRVILIALASSAVASADTLTLVTTPASQSANDSVKWSQLGTNLKTLGSKVIAKSGRGISLTAGLSGANSVTAVVCSASPCSWTHGTNFTAGHTLLWTSNAANGGNGPLSLTFATPVAGAGAFVQADEPGRFTAKIQVFNGSTSLGTFTVISDANGDATYIGVLDQTGANINRVVFSLAGCGSGDVNCPLADFAIDTINLNVTVLPLSVTLAGTGTGSVTSSPAGIVCPTTCTRNFPLGSAVTLTAKPSSGSTFVGWSGACSGTTACSVTMSTAKSVTATF
ncbi:MAG TPA: hypothetical protein VFJ47_16210 [Terriglobales bacterium]|nr:hypothetical protein [Terriglobales bacterium]